MISLTTDQDAALAKIMSWFENGNEWAMSLQGYAGTGKSTLVQEVAKQVSAIRETPFSVPRDPVAFTAPTNKAVKVLREMAARSGVAARCLTIHKMLSLRMTSDGERRELVKKPNPYESMGGYRLVVVDEASMIHDSLFKSIEEDAHRHDTKVLFVGDPLQLPPVEFGEPALESLKAYQVASLEKVVRQAESNPIINLASWLRSRLNKDEWSKEIEIADDATDGIHLVDDRHFTANAIEALAEGTKKQVDIKAIAWRNATVNQINDGVRRILYGNNPPSFVIGEQLMAASPAGGKVLYTDCEAVITGIKEQTHREIGKWKCLYLSIETEDGLKDEVPVIHPDAKLDLAKHLDAIALEAKAGQKYLWKEFWSTRDSFADLRPCYAITAHRSQGSTYENVWVDTTDILGNRNMAEGLKCLYVATTRAARNVFLREFTL